MPEQYKKPPITNRKYPEGDWKKMFSRAAGFYLKLKEQTQTVWRGGVAIEIVKTGQVHVPCIPLGHLDEYGVDVLDTMLEGNYSIMEIVEFFQNYEPKPGMVFNKKKFIEDNPPPPTPPDTEDEETEEEEEEEEGDDGDGNDNDDDGDGNDNNDDNEPKPEEPKPKKKKKKVKKEKKPKEPEKYVFNLNDPDFMKIPFMHPQKKKHTFEEWFGILYSVCDPKGLTDEQCLDVMGIRMGGSYLQELKQMRKEGRDLPYIELHFLKKDLEGRAYEDRKFELWRPSLKDKWGVHITFSKSEDYGLHLLIDKVKPDSPAWKGGLRNLDCIVSVHGWLITLMDRAEVALSLFQACGNSAILNILQSHGTAHEDNMELCCDSWV